MIDAMQSMPVLTRQMAEDFLYHEARMLDEARWRDWQALFTHDALYWVPASADPLVDPAFHISIIHDHMDLLNERIGRLESGACHSQIPPSRLLHMISNVVVAPAEDFWVVTSNQVIYEYRANTQARFYPLQTQPAFCEHHLQWCNGAWKMKLKRVRLLNCDGEIFDLSYLI
jgi:3-phenylpropionate/cinnamic acid dioxygenase small subunit